MDHYLLFLRPSEFGGLHTMKSVWWCCQKPKSWMVVNPLQLRYNLIPIDSIDDNNYIALMIRSVVGRETEEFESIIEYI